MLANDNTAEYNFSQEKKNMYIDIYIYISTMAK